MALQLCQNEAEESDDDTVCLGESFFVNREYNLTTFTFGPHSLRLLCLRSASTDYDLTGQLVWPGAVLLNNYLSDNAGILEGCSIIELGSGVGITGVLCSKFCHEVVLTDHNDEVLEIMRKNIELQSTLENPSCAALRAMKLEWGNSDHLSKILQEFPTGFDLVLGADIYILFVHNFSPLLFKSLANFP
ncbi:protein N-lysine methyltransferase METTL21A [Canna indica]|uniref:Protein N-lysine methyltransferase METTL21A n=1 Tax=Canna indica TaxID=4628 RepID=A0AAQ3K8H6_9LILI|nr:protein N-lysine methyltransferase METTL21A [Canna indica]